MRLSGISLAVLLLAGCHPSSRDALPDGPAATASAPVTGGAAAPVGDVRERPADTVIQGEATYRERVKMPPGASLTVELLALGDGGARVVATTRRPDVAGPPIPFALPYDAARVPASGRYALRAMLVGPDGERWFETGEPVPVVPGEGVPVELPMRRSASTGTSSASAPSDGPLHWECGDLGVMTRRRGDALRLDANGRGWTLPPARSASGERHADASGNAFSAAGSTARLALTGEPARDCVPARQPSPWNAALLRGVAFRAVGNEPGWFVEIDGGAQPMLRATLDHGERRIEATASPTATGYRASSGSDAIALEIRDTDCADGMSGQRFEATVVMRVGAGRYEGCGARLGD